MFKKLTLTIFSILMLISLASCGAKSSTPSGTNTGNGSSTDESSEEYPVDNYQMLPLISGKAANVSLDANADGSTQQLKVGEILAISLASNPSTGYSWTASISDPAVLAQMGEPEYHESSSTPLPGSPGTQTFFFQATAAGTTTLTLDYKRPFETNVAPEKTVQIMIEVK